jgi:hypothetical protein
MSSGNTSICQKRVSVEKKMRRHSDRAAHPPKRFRPGQEEDAPELEDEAVVERRVRPAIRNLPDALAAAGKIQQETLTLILAELKTQTMLQKKTLRYLSETQEAILDIHEALAVATKEMPTQQQQQQPVPMPTPPSVMQQLNASKDGAESPATLPLEK